MRQTILEIPSIETMIIGNNLTADFFYIKDAHN